MARNPYPSEQADRFIVRLPEGMRDRIADAAKANNRSMNSEIVARLEGSFDTEAVTPRLGAALSDLEAFVTRVQQEELEFAKFARDQIIGMRSVIEILLDRATDDAERDRIRSALYPAEPSKQRVKSPKP